MAFLQQKRETLIVKKLRGKKDDTLLLFWKERIKTEKH